MSACVNACANVCEREIEHVRVSVSVHVREKERIVILFPKLTTS